jgi:hypothetical protein
MTDVRDRMTEEMSVLRLCIFLSREDQQWKTMRADDLSSDILSSVL